MEVVVDLERVVVTFGAIEDLHAVTVRVMAPATASGDDEATVHRLADVLAATNVGELEVRPVLRALISPAAVRFHAAGQVGPGWLERFEAFCVAGGNEVGDGPLEAGVVWPGG